jgi:hypothetical protein
LIPGYGQPPPDTFLAQPVDRPDKNQYVSIDGGRPANPMSMIPMMEKGQYDAMQQPVAGPINPSFIRMGFNPVQDENGRWIT